MTAGGDPAGEARQEGAHLAPLAVRRAAWTRIWDVLLGPTPERGGDDHHMPRIAHAPSTERAFP